MKLRVRNIALIEETLVAVMTVAGLVVDELLLEQLVGVVQSAVVLAIQMFIKLDGSNHAHATSVLCITTPGVNLLNCILLHILLKYR